MKSLPLIANEERLDAEDIPTETPSVPENDAGDEVRTESVTPPSTNTGGTTSGSTAKVDNPSVAPEESVSETVVTPKPTGSNTEVTTNGQSVSTTTEGRDLNPDSTVTTAPSSDSKVEGSPSTVPSSNPSVTPSNPTVTAGPTWIMEGQRT